jgi:phenol 2-monooxygenase
LKIRLIDKKERSVQTGRADGLKSISLEILDTFGIGDSIRNESQRLEEIVFWACDLSGSLIRSGIVADRVPELGKPREIVLHQGW